LARKKRSDTPSGSKDKTTTEKATIEDVVDAVTGSDGTAKDSARKDDTGAPKSEDPISEASEAAAEVELPEPKDETGTDPQEPSATEPEDAPIAADETQPDTAPEKVAFDAPAAPEPEPEPEPEVVPEPEFTPEEPETVVQFDSIRREPEPAEAAEADMPELPFIGSARDHPRPVDAELASEPEVFIEPEPEPAPPAPSIPPTPDVPAHDAADDAPEHARGASVGARLIAASNRSLMDIGVMAEAAAALRAVRDRTQP